MEIIIVLLPLALLLGGFFIFAFIWSARKGQYDDLETPRFRMLLDDQNISKPNSTSIKDVK
jgi:cbb3-type cytochrome oxidase maturation protein